MTDKKEVNILLLGIVAILAIVGLVLLFSSPAATGKAFFPPPWPPGVQTPLPVGYEGDIYGGQYGQAKGQLGNAFLIPRLEGSNLAPCPSGAKMTRENGNIGYVLGPDYECDSFKCPSNPTVPPVVACAPKKALT